MPGVAVPGAREEKATVNYIDSIIKSNIIRFERPKTLQECSNRATRKRFPSSRHEIRTGVSNSRAYHSPCQGRLLGAYWDTERGGSVDST